VEVFNTSGNSKMALSSFSGRLTSIGNEMEGTLTDSGSFWQDGKAMRTENKSMKCAERMAENFQEKIEFKIKKKCGLYRKDISGGHGV
jgi:alpha-L-arabinofuranosidase